MDEGSPTTKPSPGLDHIIERPRLTTLLEESGARVILLFAPAGYGKTTLARQWCARQTGPVAWYRTTRASGDVAALAVGLDSLLASIAPELPRDPRRVASIASVNPRPAPLGRALVSTYRSLTRDVLLVLDEWEAAGTDDAEALVATLVEELPIRVLVTSRERPPWLATRREVYGEAFEVGLRELTMTDAEARQVLSARPEDAETEGLLATARGWPAALGLVALTANRNLPRAPRLPQALYDFLATDLLAAAPADVQEALLLVAVASVSDLATSELVLGSAAGDLIADAAARGLARIDGERSVSIHPLLKTILLDRAAALPPPKRASVLERLQPLVSNRRWDEALSTAAALPDAAFVSRALESAIDDLLHEGRVETLARWVEVGRDVGADCGLVEYVESEVLLRKGDSETALLLAERAAQQLAGDRAAQARIVASRTANFTGRPRQALQHAESARSLAHLPAVSATALWVHLVAAAEEELTECAAILAELEATPLTSVDHVLRVGQGALLLGFVEGNLERTLDDAERVSMLLSRDIDPLTRASFLHKYADALTACSYYERSLAAITAAEEIATEYGLDFVHPYLLANKARVYTGLRRFALAERSLSDLARKTVDPIGYFETYLRLARCGLYLSVGDLERARGVVFFEPRRDVGKPLSGQYFAVRALTLAALSDHRGATIAAERARRASRGTEVKGLTGAAAAISALADGRAGQAAAAIIGIAQIGAWDGLVLGCRACPSLAAHAAAIGEIHTDFRALLTRSHDEALGRKIGAAIPRSARRSKNLSPRELEIHELISQGLTNEEIAKLLYISLSTTKVHVRHILEKLGVRSRVEAARIWQGPEGPA